MEDAADDRDVKLQQVSGDLFATFKASLATLLFEDGHKRGLTLNSSVTRPVRRVVSVDQVEGSVAVIEPFQEAPQLLDPHLASILNPITHCLLVYFTTPAPSPPDTVPNSHQTLAEGLARLLYTLCKVRGHKVISRFFPNEPHLLQSVITRLTFDNAGGYIDPLEKAVEKSWELRFIILLWLSHLLLTPFDLSTISSPGPAEGEAHAAPPSDIDAFIPSPDFPFPEKLASLPQLCKTLLLLATKMLPSPSPRESEAAALVIVRLSIRKDMRALGLLEAVVEWCLRCWEDNPSGEDIDLLSTHESTINPLFLRTGSLKVLSGLFTQCESAWINHHIPKIWALVTATEDKAGSDWATEGGENAGEWSSAGVRRVTTKIYRWTGTLLLTAGSEDSDESSGIVEDVIGRLLNLLGDRDTNVRFAASKSLGVLTSKLPAEMAGEVVNAVVSGFDEDVLYENDEEILSNGQSLPSIFGDIVANGSHKKQLLVSVSPEKWHGLTLTLATFLRQRAIKPHSPSEENEEDSTTLLFQLIIHRILTALTFDQRRTTFSLGSNVRDAACYAAWALARSYYTKELIVIPLPEEYKSYPDPAHVPANVIQLLATNLIAAACLDPLGNIRRAASAALQELVGRHPNVVEEGIRVVQTVDYAGVSVRRKAVTEIARDAAALGIGYWFGLARMGLVEGWRGVGIGDVEGRRVSARGLGALVVVKQAGESDDAEVINRGRRLTGWILNRAAKEARKDVEVRHGVYWALAEVLEGLQTLTPTDAILTPLQQSIIIDVFHHLHGREFIHPPLRPELTAEASCRLVTALCKVFLTTPSDNNQKIQPLLTPPIPILLQRFCLAIVEASLEFRPEDPVLDQVIPASRELFRMLDRPSGKRVVEGWCRRVAAETLTSGDLPMTSAGSAASSVTGMGRKRGFVGGLGEVMGVLLAENAEGADKEREQLVRKVIDMLIDAATRKGNVEMRVAGIKGITRGIMSARGKGRIDVCQYPALVEALYSALDDYAVDTRGDVGSWVRTEAISAISEGWQSGVLRFGMSISTPAAGEVDIIQGLITRLIRLSVEKLDRLRSRAFFALQDIYGTANATATDGEVTSTTDLGRLIDFSLPPEVYSSPTTDAYFTALLPLLNARIPDVTRAFLTGYVIASGIGSDSLLRTASGALWEYLDGVDQDTLVRVAVGLVDVLDEAVERVTSAATETIGAGIESGVLSKVLRVPGEEGKGGAAWAKKVFMVVQKVNKGAGSVGRLIGGVRVYRALGLACAASVATGGSSEDEDVLKKELGKVEGMVRRKLVGMLIHPFPLVRREVAEALFLVLTVGGIGGVVVGGNSDDDAVEVLIETDWMGRIEARPPGGAKAFGGAKGKSKDTKEKGVKWEMGRVKKALGFV